MNSLSLGFFYLCGLAWLLGETCMSASAGNWVPLVLYFVGFLVIFGILGCLDLSEKAIDQTGVVLAVILGVTLMAYSLLSWKESGTIVGLPKVLLASAFLAGSFASIMGGKKTEDHASDH